MTLKSFRFHGCGVVAIEPGLRCPHSIGGWQVRSFVYVGIRLTRRDALQPFDRRPHRSRFPGPEVRHVLAEFGLLNRFRSQHPDGHGYPADENGHGKHEPADYCENDPHRGLPASWLHGQCHRRNPVPKLFERRGLTAVGDRLRSAECLVSVAEGKGLISNLLWQPIIQTQRC